MNIPIDAPPNPPAKPNKILAFNLVALGIYMVLFSAAPNEANILGKAFMITIQVGLNLLAGLSCLVIERRRPYAKSFLLSALLVLLIGFAACVASA